MSAAGAPRSKTFATWLALLGGSLGLHRFYLYGAGDVRAWLFPLPTAIGALGFWRMRTYGVDDGSGAMLVPLLGAMAIGMLSALVIGLTSEERWAERHGSDGAASNWLTVFGVVIALAVGAAVLVATIAFVAQRYFELNAPL